jgi:uncharacterized membrane protein
MNKDKANRLMLLSAVLFTIGLAVNLNIEDNTSDPLYMFSFIIALISILISSYVAVERGRSEDESQ